MAIRLMAVMHDDKVVYKDIDLKPNENAVYWFSEYKTVQFANFVIATDLDTGVTEVIKNRWGDKGIVRPPRE